MEIITVKKVRDSVRRKLNPNRFPGMSGKMRAITEFLLGMERTTDPAIDAMIRTSDNCVLAQYCGDLGYNAFIGAYDDLKRNWQELLACAGLTKDEMVIAETALLNVGGV